MGRENDRAPRAAEPTAPKPRAPEAEAAASVAVSLGLPDSDTPPSPTRGSWGGEGVSLPSCPQAGQLQKVLRGQCPRAALRPGGDDPFRSAGPGQAQGLCAQLQSPPGHPAGSLEQWVAWRARPCDQGPCSVSQSRQVPSAGPSAGAEGREKE